MDPGVGSMVQGNWSTKSVRETLGNAGFILGPTSEESTEEVCVWCALKAEEGKKIQGTNKRRQRMVLSRGRRSNLARLRGPATLVIKPPPHTTHMQRLYAMPTCDTTGDT